MFWLRNRRLSGKKYTFIRITLCKLNQTTPNKLFDVTWVYRDDTRSIDPYLKFDSGQHIEFCPSMCLRD
jgi:hypothetical protein